MCAPFFLIYVDLLYHLLYSISPSSTTPFSASSTSDTTPCAARPSAQHRAHYVLQHYAVFILPRSTTPCSPQPPVRCCAQPQCHSGWSTVFDSVCIICAPSHSTHFAPLCLHMSFPILQKRSLRPDQFPLIVSTANPCDAHFVIHSRNCSTPASLLSRSLARSHIHACARHHAS